MRRLWVSMGRKPQGNVRAPLSPVLCEFDLDSGALLREFTLPDGLGPPDAHAEFTSCSLDGGRLWLPTRSEVLCLDAQSWQILARWSHPLLYDVHSVVPGPDGRLAVSCAGHESVLVFSTSGELLARHWLRGSLHAFTRDYDSVRDFRAVPFDRFKPHSHHPNYAAWHGDSLWVTALEAGACWQIEGPGRIPLPEGPPHDGVVRDGMCWFTTVNGWLIGVDLQTGQRSETLNLATLDPRPGLMGWCRGVEVVGRRAFVGMTMLRSGRHRELLRRLTRGAEGVKRPTRVVEVDLDACCIVREFPLGNSAGGTLYGIVAAPA